MTINKHGMKINGLKAASHTTKTLVNGNRYNPHYCIVYYNTASGDVWANEYYDIGHGSYTAYDDNDIIRVCETTSAMTMQQIADAVSANA